MICASNRLKKVEPTKPKKLNYTLELLKMAWRNQNKNKYRAIPEIVDGIRFASGREAKRYRELKLLERGMWISGLELQPKYKLGTADAPILLRSERCPNGRRAAYFADFRYRNSDGETVIEDVKGIDNPLSKLKRAIVEAQYRVKIVLI